MNFSTVLPRLLPFPALRLLDAPLGRLLGLPALERRYGLLRNTGRPIAQELLAQLEVACRISERDLEQIPRAGPVVVVANHPYGILEGAALAALLEPIRPDARFLANGILSLIPEVRDLVIPVDPVGKGAQNNSGGLRQALEFLEQGGLLVVFPVGEVSHLSWRERAVTDPEWHSTAARMVEIASRRGHAPAVVPAYIRGANGLLFQAAGLAHPRLRTALLGRELLNKRGRKIEIRIGSPISAEKLLAIRSPGERTRYLRWRTYLLADREQYKARTALPLGRRRAGRAAEAVAPPAPAELLAGDMAALPAGRLLGKSGELEVWLAEAGEIPHVLQEIGRLREISFRAAGEGTGKARDLDRFDQHYVHLFLWNRGRREVAGAYRLAATDRVTERFGLAGLYTDSLFDYGEEFVEKTGPALELGRSFIRPEYQKSFAPLLLLWKGIGAYVARNPQYKILFGPVSISNRYQSCSRELMVSFLERRASLKDWMGLVSARNPFRPHRRAQGVFESEGFGIEELSEVVSDIEPGGAGVPVLLRQYLKLGGKPLSFNVDPEFSNALDGLILVDLTRTEPRLLARYLGKEESARFLAHHRPAAVAATAAASQRAARRN